MRDLLSLATSLPVTGIHVDLVRATDHLDAVLKAVPKDMEPSLDVVDGRSIWRTDLHKALALLKRAADSRDWQWDLGGSIVNHTVGFWVRNDYIPDVSRSNTSSRQFVQAFRADRVLQTDYALYYQNETQWLEKFCTVQGIRYDLYQFDVNSFYSGNQTWGTPQPKFSAIFGPWAKSEFCFNYGMGFHSNDARGVTATVDPVNVDPTTGAPIITTHAPGVVQTEGGEIGFRSEYIEGLKTTCALWYLKVDSELFFDGDAGSVEPSLASRRYGVEWNSYYNVTEWLLVDGELAYSNARFAQFNPEGNYVPRRPLCLRHPFSR